VPFLVFFMLAAKREVWHGTLQLFPVSQRTQVKEILEDLSSGQVERSIVPSVFYYLKKGSIYYAVNNKRSLLQALNDRRKEVRKFIRKNDLGIRHDKENTLMKVAAWYNGEISNTANK